MGLDLEAARRKAAADGKLATKPVAPAQTSAPKTEVSAYVADTIPDLGFAKDEFDQQMDQLINSLGILDYYRVFCGKMVPNILPGQRESIIVSCPRPSHPDKNPSAWINTDKGTWYCAACGEGGDGYDIAAMSMGFPIPGYKQGKTFHELRTAIAQKLGFTVLTGITKAKVLVPPEGQTLPEPKPPVVRSATPPAVPASPGKVPTLQDFLKPTTGVSAPVVPKAGVVEPPADAPQVTPAPTAAEPSEAPSPPAATVTPIPTETAVAADESELGDADADFEYPQIDWRDIIPKGTFLDVWMNTLCETQIPEEYHFWHGLVALGLAMGFDTQLKDSPKVNGNLFICTVGASGAGKSQSVSYLNELMARTLPFDWDDPSSRGVRRIPTPGSGEQLVFSFQRNLPLDPAKPKDLSPVPIKGLVQFAEFASFVARGERSGSTLKNFLMDMYDNQSVVDAASRTGGELVAHDPFASVVSTTQLKSIRRLMRANDADSGFLNRWVFAMGPRKDRDFFGDHDTVELQPAVDSLKSILGWTSANALIVMPQPVAQATAKWHTAFVRKFRDDDTTVMFSRIDLLLKKLFLLFSVNAKEKFISMETLETVKKLLPYIIATYNAVADRIGNNEENEISTDIQHVIETHTIKYKVPPTLRDIKRRLHRKKYTDNQLTRAVETLCKMQILAEETITSKTSPGRPALRYRLAV